MSDRRTARAAYLHRLDWRVNDHLHRKQETTMPDRAYLDEFVTPIRSGMDPAPVNAGRLDAERRASLGAALEALADARARAEVESRTYVVRGERP